MKAKKQEGYNSGKWRAGVNAWGKVGVLVGQMGELPACLYMGHGFDENASVVIPKDPSKLTQIWTYVQSEEFRLALRKIDQSLKITCKTLVKVPFDEERWSREAEIKYPTGFPALHTADSTQWIFAGGVRSATCSLQVAAARLVGYRWPAENDPDMTISDETRVSIERAKALHRFEDEDGIVCIPSVRGERLGHERLLQLLQAAWGDEWRDSVLTQLLTNTGSSNLDDWLRNECFQEHCKLFQHRPFIWHIWDGRKRDGFHALVNYHKLVEGDGNGRRLLESLTYSYLGDWLARQQDGVKRGEGGAEDRLAAALELQKRLVAILEGERPFDLFVRWKPIEEQSIGWEPDIDDGVRLNIRPFMAHDLPGGKKGAGILRAKPNIHWKKDRGKEPLRDQAQFPWFWKNDKFTGERVNDVHLRMADKRAARAERRANTDD